MNTNLNVVCPNYLCYDTLPYAADIFYHEKLTYLMPTGISQVEWMNVIEFPQYCKERDIALPKLLWEMPEKYFDCAKQAVECSEILKPLGEKILRISTVYPRDITSISKCRRKLKENPLLMDSFLASADDFNFLTREVFSHIFLEVYLEGGFGLVKKCIEENFCSSEKLYELFAAVCLNRLYNIDFGSNMNCILYSHSWHPFLREYSRDLHKDEEKNDSSTDPIAHRLFTEVVSPIFGRCNSLKETEHISRIADKQNEAIVSLKKACKEIVEASIFQSNEQVDLRDKKIKEMIVEKIIEPLSYIISKPKNDVKQIVTDFVLDSTVIGGILGLTQGLGINSVGLSAAAGFISAGLKYIVNEEKQKKQIPEKFILNELKRNKMSYMQYEKKLQQISFSQINIL